MNIVDIDISIFKLSPVRHWREPRKITASGVIMGLVYITPLIGHKVRTGTMY